MALTSIPLRHLPQHAYVLTGRTMHRTTIWLDEDGEVEAASCALPCGAVWSELNDPPATCWYHTHPQPDPPARAAA